MKKKILLGCGGLIAVLLIIVIIAVVGGLLGTAPMASAADDFMTALQDGEWDTAYGLCSPSLQSQLQSASNLSEMIVGGSAQPEKWKFTSRNVENGQGEVEGSVTMTGGVAGTVSVTLAKADDGWQVNGFNLQPN